MKFLSPLSFLILLTIFSCGEDNTDNDDNTVPFRQEEAANPVRWSRIDLQTVDGFLNFYDHRLSMDLNKRPLIVTGTFQDKPLEDEDLESCTFTVTLTDSEAIRLEEEADDLDVCTEEGTDNDVIIEGPSNVISLTDLSGNTITANKNKFGDFDIDQVWLCEGKRTFYSAVTGILRGRLPGDCPEDALDQF